MGVETHRGAQDQPEYLREENTVEYCKARTGKVIHSTACEHKINPVRVSEEEARDLVEVQGVAEYCPDTLRAQAKAEKADQPDIEGAGWQVQHKHQGASPERDLQALAYGKATGLLNSFLDTLNSRMEAVNRRKAARARLRALDEANALGLEPGDTVKQKLPNRTERRNARGKGISLTGSQIFGRPAGRRKVSASLFTHSAHINHAGIMFRYALGNVETAVPARKRDRAAVAAAR